jgi:uncharacterized membrane protein
MIMARRILLVPIVVSLAVLFFYALVYPIPRYLFALPSLPGTTMVVTISAWLFSLCHAVYTLGWRQALTFFGISAVITWLFEQVGVATGLIYGAYHYTDVLGPKLGYVPLLIPIAWFMMVYPSYVIANLIGAGKPVGAGGGAVRIIWFSALGAMTLTAWDLLIDPGMSSPPEQSFIWERGGAYFGVPLQNFLGWLLTAFIVYLIYRLIERKIGVRPLAPEKPLMSALPLVAYFIFLFNGLVPGVAAHDALRIIALFTMGFPLLAATGRLVIHTIKEKPPTED